jgi:hypothetical protein
MCVCVYMYITSLFREYKEKLDLKDHNEDDTVSFNPRDYFIFKREKSGGLTGDEVITIPHAAILVRNLIFFFISARCICINHANNHVVQLIKRH